MGKIIDTRVTIKIFADLDSRELAEQLEQFLANQPWADDPDVAVVFSVKSRSHYQKPRS